MKLESLLSKFQADNVETVSAWFQTRVPAVAEYAYLNIIYKAAPVRLRKQAFELLRFPNVLARFYNSYNGARLFHDYFSIYGILDPAMEFDRSDPYALPPFGIAEANSEHRCELENRDLVCIGWYGYDGSEVCLRREDGVVVCFKGSDFSVIRHQWEDFEQWVTSEIERISTLHDEKGHLLIDSSSTLPNPVQ